MTEPTPSTEAGRALADQLRNAVEMMRARYQPDQLGQPVVQDELIAAILAIEAEAVTRYKESLIAEGKTVMGLATVRADVADAELWRARGSLDDGLSEAPPRVYSPCPKCLSTDLRVSIRRVADALLWPVRRDAADRRTHPRLLQLMPVRLARCRATAERIVSREPRLPVGRPRVTVKNGPRNGITLEGWLRRFGILNVNGSEARGGCEHRWYNIRTLGMTVAIRCSLCHTDPMKALLGGTVYRGGRR